MQAGNRARSGITTRSAEGREFLIVQRLVYVVAERGRGIRVAQVLGDRLNLPSLGNQGRGRRVPQRVSSDHPAQSLLARPLDHVRHVLPGVRRSVARPEKPDPALVNRVEPGSIRPLERSASAIGARTRKNRPQDARRLP